MEENIFVKMATLKKEMTEEKIRMHESIIVSLRKEHSMYEEMLVLAREDQEDVVIICPDCGSYNISKYPDKNICDHLCQACGCGFNKNVRIVRPDGLPLDRDSW